MMISWLDLVSVYVRCMFSRMLLWLYKLILSSVNFLTENFRSDLGVRCMHSQMMVGYMDVHKVCRIGKV
jgi:hypothetical protein